MTFDAEHMLDNAAAISQHRPMVEDRVLQTGPVRIAGATLPRYPFTKQITKSHAHGNGRQAK